jgi:hypothetical protein
MTSIELMDPKMDLSMECVRHLSQVSSFKQAIVVRAAHPAHRNAVLIFTY